jgi:hypothetical protein
MFMIHQYFRLECTIHSEFSSNLIIFRQEICCTAYHLNCFVDDVHMSGSTVQLICLGLLMSL